MFATEWPGFQKFSQVITLYAISFFINRYYLLFKENNLFIMFPNWHVPTTLLIDFSKAFDSVDHIILINKLKSLNISDNVIQWVVSFLTDRM